MRARLGDDHVDVGTVISNIGDVNNALKRKSEALENYRAALKIRWTNLGARDPKVVRLMQQIAYLETGPQPVKKRHNEHDESDDDEAAVGGDSSFMKARGVEEDVQILQDELQEDMKFFDLVERQMAIDMLKDKMRIFREMRDLYNGVAPPDVSEHEDRSVSEGDRLEEHSIKLFEAVKSVPGGNVDEATGAGAAASPPPTLRPKLATVEADFSEHSLETARVVSPLSGDIPDTSVRRGSYSPANRPVQHSPTSRKAAANLSSAERVKAIESVKERVAKMRAARMRDGGVQEDSLTKKSYMYPTASSAAKAVVATSR
jgi:hypothetical protein